MTGKTSAGGTWSGADFTTTRWSQVLSGLGQPHRGSADPAIKHARSVHSVRFSPDGLRLVTACGDGTARIWDAATGHPLTEPFRHGAAVHYAEFSLEGDRIVTASADHTARVWGVPSSPGAAPAWLAELAEALAGQRIDERDISFVVPAEKLFELRKRFLANTEKEFYANWARWFFANNSTNSPWLAAELPVKP